MAQFRQPPHSLILDQEIIVRIQAHNIRGWGLYGLSTGGIKVQSEPDAMDAPFRDQFTTNKQLVVDWNYLPITRIGKSPVTSYNLWWDEGSNGEFWYSLIGISEPILAQSSFTVTNGVLEGQDYKFKVRARNIWGWGPFSPIATIRASTVPNAPTSIITSYDATTGDFKITWSLPKNNGDVVTEYKIEIYSNPNSAWNTELSTCDGANSDVVLYRTCSIPVNTLYLAPHNLIYQQFVLVRVAAKNVIGFGSSGANSAAVSNTLLKSKPFAMSAPTRGTSTSINEIQV